MERASGGQPERNSAVPSASGGDERHPIAGACLRAHGQGLRQQFQNAVRVAQLEHAGDAQVGHTGGALQHPGAVALQLGQEVVQAHVLGIQRAPHPGIGMGRKWCDGTSLVAVEADLFACLHHQGLAGLRGRDLHGSLQHGQRGAVRMLANGEPGAQGAQQAVVRLHHEGQSLVDAVVRSLHQDLARMVADPARFAVETGADGGGCVRWILVRSS